VASASAVAAVPEHGTFIVRDEGTDPAGTTCGLPVHYSQVARGYYRIFSDRNGNFVRTLVHIHYDATISANGITLIERDTFTRTFYADGTMRDAGLTDPLQGPGGIVLRDAGQIIHSDFDETAASLQGPHPQLFAESFCEALTP
jgi:hypothetical protein